MISGNFGILWFSFVHFGRSTFALWWLLKFSIYLWGSWDVLVWFRVVVLRNDGVAVFVSPQFGIHHNLKWLCWRVQLTTTWIFCGQSANCVVQREITRKIPWVRLLENGWPSHKNSDHSHGSFTVHFAAVFLLQPRSHFWLLFSERYCYNFWWILNWNLVKVVNPLRDHS